MKQYYVRVTDEALKDLESIYEYIDQELFNHTAAVRIYNKLIDGMESLREMPDRIKAMDSVPEHKRSLRLMPVENYVIIFVIRDDIVTIINVFYGASDIIGKLNKQ